MTLRTLTGLLLFPGLIVCAIAMADPPAASPTDAAGTPTTQPLRDPTQADPALARILAGKGSGRSLPQVTRLGLIVVAGQQPEALIMVKGTGTFIVHEGSTLTAGDNTVLRVAHLSADSMEITIDSQKQTMIVR